MISSFAVGLLPTIVQAQPDLPTITMYGIRTSDPFWGYYGGYHDMWAAIKPELLKLGIDIKIDTMDGFTLEALFYDDWNISGQNGWDFASREWWLNPTSHIWLDEMVLAKAVPTWNVMPWMDEEADYLYEQAIASVDDPVRYKQFMWLWQEAYMHNPPVVNNYYAEMATARAAYLDGYDDTSWVYGLREMRVDQAAWDALDAANQLPAARKAIGSDTLIWAGVEPIDQWHPFYTVYYTEEAMNALRFGMLYRNEREHNDYPPSGDYVIHPDLAADFPTWYDAEDLYPGVYPEGYAVAQMPIREGIVWSDGVPFNATDVAFSINSIIDKKAASSGRADYIHIIEETIVVNATTVDIICTRPRFDLAGYFAHAWGFAMLPYHQFVEWEIEDKLTAWSTHDSNYDPIPESQGGLGLEVLGPYVPISSDYPALTYVQFKRFDVATGENWYWAGLDLPLGADNYGEKWGWALPENFIVKVIPDAAARLIALQTLECDFAEYPTAPIETYQAMEGWPTHKVYKYAYPASHPLWMNLNNPILSNRYVRLAIAHAIPYPKIYNEILPGWGVANVIPGLTFVTPWMDAFNTELEPYEYDIEKAKKYMWMYWNSLDKNTRSGNDAKAVYEAGPVGDADFSGLVDLDDLFVWRDRFLYGPAPSTYAQYDFPYTATFPEIDDFSKYWPGNDVDPDFDNDDDVDWVTGDPPPASPGDWELWSINRGTTYPFPGAR